MLSTGELSVTYRAMVNLFAKANRKFLEEHRDLISTDVGERTLCGALAQCIWVVKGNRYRRYEADVEYNRNGAEVKTILNGEYIIVPIQCDLILHSRGKMTPDNLIALEMKKEDHATEAEKEKDRNRLKCLTKDPYTDEQLWNYGGKDLKYVCGYTLGVYYEISKGRDSVLIEYYSKGELVKKYRIKL